MSKPSKRVQQPQKQVTAHPETRQPAPKQAPGDESSKVEATSQRDARTGQDKDGNDEHPKTAKKAVSR